MRKLWWVICSAKEIAHFINLITGVAVFLGVTFFLIAFILGKRSLKSLLVVVSLRVGKGGGVGAFARKIKKIDEWFKKLIKVKIMNTFFHGLGILLFTKLELQAAPFCFEFYSHYGIGWKKNIYIYVSCMKKRNTLTIPSLPTNI